MSIFLPDNMYQQRIVNSMFLAHVLTHDVETRAVLPPTNLDRSKRNQMCSIYNYFADEKNKATVNLFPQTKNALFAKPYAKPPLRTPKKRSVLFALAAENFTLTPG